MPVHPLFQTSPFPMIDSGGALQNGYRLKQSEFCLRDCADRPCKSYVSEQPGDGVSFRTCPYGFSVALARSGRLAVAVNGVVEQESNESESGFRKRHKDRKLKRTEFESWFRSVVASSPEFDRLVAQAGRDSIAALHDIKAAIGSLLRATENWVWQQPGESIEDRVEAAGPELRTVYQACRLLEAMLQMTDVIANPESARFGAPAFAAIYKLVDMLARVLSPRGLARGVNLHVHGRSFAKVRVYSSFILVPLALLDNAVKYAENDTRIDVEVMDRPGGAVHIAVSSFGPIVQPAERTAIFARGVRGTNVTGRGTGLGLFVAQEIARLHGTTVRYDCREDLATPGRGWNTFSIQVASIAG